MAINSNAEVDSLIEAGKYQRAAELAERSGLALKAAELWERIWEFGRAAACARRGGDLPWALRNAVEARDEALIDQLIRELEARGESGSRAAVEILAERRHFDRAARLAEKIGDTERAIELFESGHLDMDAARLLAAAGRDREAGRLLERLLRLGEGGDHLPAASLLLGQILARRMQHEEAVRHLQEAARHQATRSPARRALVVELAALGLRSAARDVLAQARRDDPELPATVDEVIRAERAALAPRRSGDRQLVAGRYHLDQLLGSGGAGRVYRARDEVTGRDVALKLWSTELARSAQAYERFVREAKIASSLRHPNLVECYDFSADMGYMVMELMEGSLADRLESGEAMGQRTARRMALDILAGLELAHQRGVIHRDVKPANVFFDARGTAKLGDFGVAHLLDLGQTQTGGLIGTLAYMAPEQITGAPLTIGADLYALGVTLFQALTGRLPFVGPDFVAQHLGQAPPAPTDVAALEPGWDAVLLRLLAKSPGDRFESIEELRRGLRAVDLGQRGASPLILPRASGADGDTEAAEDDEPASRSASLPAIKPSAEGDDGQPRYRFETPIGKTSVSRLSRALDSSLDRSVIIERFQPSAMGEDTLGEIEERLFALARGGGPFLQRALSYDRHEHLAIFEAPAGALLGEIDTRTQLTPRLAARLLKRLARALGPLHERGVGHGAIEATTVLCDEAWNPTVLTCGLEPPTSEASPEADAAAVIELVAGTLGVEASAEGLLSGLAPELSHPERAALLSLDPPDDAESLYRFADAAEIALLTIWRRGWSRGAPRSS